MLLLSLPPYIFEDIAERLLDRTDGSIYTPPTEAYAMLCTQVKDIAMTERPPLPVWVSGQRKSGRRANKNPGLGNHGCV